LLIGLERERPDLVPAMTIQALLLEDRPDVPRVGRRGGVLGGFRRPLLACRRIRQGEKRRAAPRNGGEARRANDPRRTSNPHGVLSSWKLGSRSRSSDAAPARKADPPGRDDSLLDPSARPTPRRTHPCPGRNPGAARSTSPKSRPWTDEDRR